MWQPRFRSYAHYTSIITPVISVKRIGKHLAFPNDPYINSEGLQFMLDCSDSIFPYAGHQLPTYLKQMNDLEYFRSMISFRFFITVDRSVTLICVHFIKRSPTCFSATKERFRKLPEHHYFHSFTSPLYQQKQLQSSNISIFHA